MRGLVFVQWGGAEGWERVEVLKKRGVKLSCWIAVSVHWRRKRDGPFL